MNFTIERKALVDALPRALAVIDRKGTIPILEHFLLRANTDGLMVAATDMDRRIEIDVACRVEAPGAAAVPGRLLYDAVRSLPDGAEIRIRLDPAGDRVAVVAGRSRFRLPILPVEEFPAFETPDAGPFEIAARDLLRLLDRTHYAMSNEEVRYYLNGVYLHAAPDWTPGSSPGAAQERRLRAVATNGHVLARADVPLPEAADAMPPAIVPRQMVEILRDWLKAAPGDAAAAVTVTDRLIRVKAPWLGQGELGATVSSKLIDGSFPDYQRVIPTGDGTTRVIASADDLVAAARRAVIAANAEKDGRAVKLAIALAGNRAEIRVSASSAIGAEAESAVDADLDGEALEVGFNASYLAETVSALACDTVAIATNGPGDPARFENPADDSVLAIVMPMRV